MNNWQRFLPGCDPVIHDPVCRQLLVSPIWPIFGHCHWQNSNGIQRKSGVSCRKRWSAVMNGLSRVEVPKRWKCWSAILPQFQCFFSPTWWWTPRMPQLFSVWCQGFWTGVLIFFVVSNLRMWAQVGLGFWRLPGLDHDCQWSHVITMAMAHRPASTITIDQLRTMARSLVCLQLGFKATRRPGGFKATRRPGGKNSWSLPCHAMSLCHSRIHWFTMIWDSLEWLCTIHDRMLGCGWSRKQNHLGQI